MAAEPEEITWPAAYFNYFTEVEDHFRKARATGLFLMSPLDWALVESWKNAGVPLEAVLRGIDTSLEKWRSRRNRTQMVNSIAYCTQAVMAEAQIMAGAAPPSTCGKKSEAPFSIADLDGYLKKNSAALSGLPGYEEIAAALDRLRGSMDDAARDLEDLERRLTALEEKMISVARSRQSDEDSIQARRELDSQLRPYRGKMTAAQLAMLEKQYLDRQLMESAGLPRLSLFYLI
jgi:hypothetical protein